MQFVPDILPEAYDGTSSSPAPKPKPEPKSAWDNAVTYFHTRENADGYVSKVKQMFNHILEDIDFAPTYDQLKNLFAHGNGEADKFDTFKQKLIMRTARNDVDLAQNDGELVILLAKHGKRCSIGEVLQTSDNWPKKAIKEAVDIALNGDKPGTAESISRYAPIVHLDVLCDAYFAHEESKARKNLQDETLARIGRKFDTIDKLYDVKASAPRNLRLFIHHYAKNNLKNTWRMPNDKEATFNVESHGVSITRLFNFKADHVHITTQSKNGLTSEIKSFNEYKGDDEIVDAYKFLKLVSENPPEMPALKRQKPKIKPPSKSL